MACGISLFSENYWIGFLTWIAFAVVATFVVTFWFARRAGSRGTIPASSETERLSGRIDELSRRLEAMEAKSRGT